ncbi:breast cancer metastasis-suppressor 1 isoform X1 [Ranitomeya variabilis]|uniref:breast cancer metastasis-suppressor 1 isoform X1 n=1 Tax=Ranitomeya variabilis TaxID=490064 RepID=UPI004055D34E
MEPEADSATEMNGQEEVDSEREDSVSQSDSEEESSDMDDLDCERRRNECLDEMCHLEKQFSELKEKLFKERLSQLKAKLEEVTCGKALEYISPLADLQNNMKIRIEVAGIYKGFCLDVIKNRYECELQGAKQHLESEKILLFDNMQCELLERIQRLEEDRQSIDISSEWWDEELRSKRSRRKWDPFRSEKKRKVPLVSGPYIVYMLRDLDILEDWTAIKKCPPSGKQHNTHGPVSPNDWLGEKDFTVSTQKSPFPMYKVNFNPFLTLDILSRRGGVGPYDHRRDSTSSAIGGAHGGSAAGCQLIITADIRHYVPGAVTDRPRHINPWHTAIKHDRGVPAVQGSIAQGGGSLRASLRPPEQRDVIALLRGSLTSSSLQVPGSKMAAASGSCREGGGLQSACSVQALVSQERCKSDR